MNTREVQSRLKGGSRQSSDAKAVNLALEGVKATVGLSWFVALGNFWDRLNAFYKANGQYFFLFSILISYMGWVLSAIDLHHSANKNIGKIANFIYGTFSLLLTVAVAVGFVMAGPVVGGTLLIASMFLDPLVNLARAIFYGIKAALEVDSGTKHQLKERALTHGAYAGLGGLISSIFVLLMIIALPAVVTIPLALVGIAAMVTLVFIAPKLVSAIVGPVPQPVLSILLDEMSDDEEEMVLLPESVAGLNVTPSGYYRNTMTKMPASSEEFDTKIQQHIHKLENDHTRDKDSIWEKIWPQEPKRRNKISALELLKQMKAELAKESVVIPDQATPEAPFEFLQYRFHYTTKVELCNKIAERVVDSYKGVFQSTGAEIGDTQSRFNELFLCIINGVKLLPKDQNSDENQSAIRLRK